jgi:cell division protein FtsW (lipid II flippase)
MNAFLRKLLGMNWPLVALAIGLSAFGIMAIYSATYMREEVYLTEMWRRQIIWLSIGVVVFFVAALVDYRAWMNNVSMPLIMYLGGLGFSGTYPFHWENDLRREKLVGNRSD